MNEINTDAALLLFDEIEKRVNQLFEKIEALEKEKTLLETRIRELEQEVGDKTEAARKLAEEKELVRARVDALLEKINNFMVLDNDARMEEG
ncbi:MAG: hypothetical protein B5M56_00560 [Desulfococcus sp. 4484_241]|nr:MAG: hypothetical protein B5M56_00560 [Desulfococcus sp. 4484_241]RLC32252.1 MAG: hypothetical protein DRH32_03085 [Deltaproteobacteria bacterium]